MAALNEAATFVCGERFYDRGCFALAWRFLVKNKVFRCTILATVMLDLRWGFKHYSSIAEILLFEKGDSICGARRFFPRLSFC